VVELYEGGLKALDRALALADFPAVSTNIRFVKQLLLDEKLFVPPMSGDALVGGVTVSFVRSALALRLPQTQDLPALNKLANFLALLLKYASYPICSFRPNG